MTEYLNNVKILKELNEKYLTDAQLISIKYERQQLNEYKQSLTRQNDLTQICAFTISKTTAIMATSKKLEIEIQSKRIKVISQFTSLLNRYDSEIGDKKNYLEELRAERFDLEENLKEIEEIINQQSVIYDEYMYKRRQVDVDRMEAIIKSHAARTIQRWWKNILQKRKKTKKKKKKKKKKRKIL
ncbi:dynein regulatory complex protein 10-like [Cotesia glomerata]|nr:dynein regulatory complex protein 10-like [Cotesia glomerata]